MTLEFRIYVKDLKEFLKQTGNKNQKVIQAIRYESDEKRATVQVGWFSSTEIDVLLDVIDAVIKNDKNQKTLKDNKWTRGRIQSYLDLNRGVVEETTKVRNVEALCVSLRRYLETNAPHRWVFSERKDRIAAPYFVTSIEYHKRRRDREGNVYPAHTDLAARGYVHGEKTSISARWSESDFAPCTVREALMAEDLLPETPVAVEKYLASLEVYAKYQSACGVQVNGTGDAFNRSTDRWSRSWGTVPLVRNDIATRLVLDPLTEEIESNKGDDEPRVFTTDLWEDKNLDRNGLTKAVVEGTIEEDEFGDDEEALVEKVEVMLPLHPYLYAFDLDKHDWLDVNVENIVEYPWDKKLIEKLVLPDDQKNLLNVLMSTTGENVGDIVKGKMNGIIVMATGAPGVGKTLTAEVFSEFIEKPLYSVQCSQLGLSVDDIEGNLQKVLNRAGRWGAVLLIDEADVYVRQRGEDIVQNAIVGVFLRLLEYYRGVLFMTSNVDAIDDAILSRATAWVRYRLPDANLLRQIWTVLAEQFKVKLSTTDVKNLIEKMPHLSGRSVRNILKLGVLLNGRKATVNDLIEVSQYQALETKESVYAKNA
ncbi:MAG TPA: AAA family ATPase [Chloroflexota bacterium]|nr:AAA family ATPase [Chloroflexota bacterium]